MEMIHDENELLNYGVETFDAGGITRSISSNDTVTSLESNIEMTPTGHDEDELLNDDDDVETFDAGGITRSISSMVMSTGNYGSVDRMHIVSENNNFGTEQFSPIAFVPQDGYLLDPMHFEGRIDELKIMLNNIKSWLHCLGMQPLEPEVGLTRTRTYRACLSPIVGSDLFLLIWKKTPSDTSSIIVEVKQQEPATLISSEYAKYLLVAAAGKYSFEDPMPPPKIEKGLRDHDIFLTGGFFPESVYLASSQFAYKIDKIISKLHNNRGCVYLCKLLIWKGYYHNNRKVYQETEDQRVVKQVLHQRSNALEDPCREIAVMQQLHNSMHHQVLHSQEALYDEKYYYIVVDYFPSGDLQQVCENDEKRSILRPQDLSRELVRHLQFLQMHHIIHRDISPNNILVDLESETHRFTLFDFAYAQRFWPNVRQTPPLRVVGKLPYMSDKVFTRQPQEPNVYALDIWSLGATLFTVLANIFWESNRAVNRRRLVLYYEPGGEDIGFDIFITRRGLINDEELSDALQQIGELPNDPTLIDLRERIIAVTRLPVYARDFLFRMFQPDVTPTELLEHPWVNSVNG